MKILMMFFTMIATVGLLSGWLLVLFPVIVFLLLPIVSGVFGTLLIIRKSFRVIQNSDLVVRSIECIDNGDPIVNFSINFPKLQTINPLVSGRRYAGKLLQEADAALPRGIHLLVTEGYKSKKIEIISEEKIVSEKLKQNPFNSPEHIQDEINELFLNFLDAGHQTGGAFDLTLIDDHGAELDLGERISKKMNWYGGVLKSYLPPQIIRNREILSFALAKVGFINNPIEWWHWSYGDKFWCAVTKGKNAIYQ